ncbi:MAG TPA: molybdenum cofactor guanylyltransferase [Saprospiraceae bacterium]|nr:molybdenum cofactor guanylyltransferase [Saprospiraceae bacterium]
MDAFILAGGLSTRMGEEKGLVSFCGKPMIEYTIDLLHLLNFNITVISSNAEYKKYSLPLVSDVVSQVGPAGGILTAMEYSSSEHFLLVACDMPLLQEHSISKLQNSIGNHKSCMYSFNGKLEPLCGFYSKSMRELWRKKLEEGDKKLSILLQAFDVKLISLDQEPADLKSFNSKAEIDSFEKEI